MNFHAKAEKWGPLALGIVCAFLIVRVIAQIRNGRPQPVHAMASLNGPISTRRNQRPSANLESASDPGLHLAAMRASEERAPVAVARNPFEFVIPKPKARLTSAFSRPAPPPTPPPPPPLPLKALGFATEANGAEEAYITYQDQVFVVRPGDAIAKRYRVIELGPTSVQVIDETTGQRAELPIPK